MRGGVAVASAESLFVVERSLPHGHVAAALGAALAELAVVAASKGLSGLGAASVLSALA